MTPLKERERSQEEWNRKARDAVNGHEKRTRSRVFPKTVNFSQGQDELSLIVNKGSSCTVTLLSAVSNPNVTIMIKVLTAHTVVSASSNVCPIASLTPGTAILPATAGAWAILRSDGAHWHIMARGT